MKIHEYQGKAIFYEHSMPGPEGYPTSAGIEALTIPVTYVVRINCYPRPGSFTPHPTLSLRERAFGGMDGAHSVTRQNRCIQEFDIMRTSSIPVPPGRKKLSRSFRKRQSMVESLLWSQLRNRGIGVKFRRQVPVGPYITDFLSLEIRLIVEVDGIQHGKESARVKDRERDQFLKGEGYEVVHYWARDVTANFDACLQHLAERIEKRRRALKQNVPSPQGRRLG